MTLGRVTIVKHKPEIFIDPTFIYTFSGNVQHEISKEGPQISKEMMYKNVSSSDISILNLLQ
jgi:hypothetical protein